MMRFRRGRVLGVGVGGVVLRGVLRGLWVLRGGFMINDVYDFDRFLVWDF